MSIEKGIRVKRLKPRIGEGANQFLNVLNAIRSDLIEDEKDPDLILAEPHPQVSVTQVAGIILSRTNPKTGAFEVMLVHGREKDFRQFPGGKSAKGETLEDALERELEEELGLSGLPIKGREKSKDIPPHHIIRYVNTYIPGASVDDKNKTALVIHTFATAQDCATTEEIKRWREDPKVFSDLSPEEKKRRLDSFLVIDPKKMGSDVSFLQFTDQPFERPEGRPRKLTPQTDYILRRLLGFEGEKSENTPPEEKEVTEKQRKFGDLTHPSLTTEFHRRMRQLVEDKRINELNELKKAELEKYWSKLVELYKTGIQKANLDKLLVPGMRSLAIAAKILDEEFGGRCKFYEVSLPTTRFSVGYFDKFREPQVKRASSVKERCTYGLEIEVSYPGYPELVPLKDGDSQQHHLDISVRYISNYTPDMFIRQESLPLSGGYDDGKKIARLLRTYIYLFRETMEFEKFKIKPEFREFLLNSRIKEYPNQGEYPIGRYIAEALTGTRQNKPEPVGVKVLKKELEEYYFWDGEIFRARPSVKTVTQLPWILQVYKAAKKARAGFEFTMPDPKTGDTRRYRIFLPAKYCYNILNML